MPDTPTTPTGWADHDIAWDHTSDINDWAANHEALREGCQGCAKIARIEAEARDALTAAVRDMPGLSLHQAEGDTSNDFPLVERAAVLAILGKPHETREDDGHMVTYTRFVELPSTDETFLPIDGKPHHIVVTRDGLDIRWYVDGEVPAVMGEVAHYTRPLSADRIRVHANAGLDLDDPVVREAQVYGGDDRARHVMEDRE